MRIFQLDATAAATLRRTDLSAALYKDGSRWLVTEHTKDRIGHTLPRRKTQAISYQPHTIDEARWRDAVARLVFGWSAATCSPLPKDVEHEALLWLYTWPSLRVEYMGRGSLSARASAIEEKIRYLDLAGGRRKYAFRIMASDGAAPDPRLEAVAAMYRRAGEWLDDPSARVVLSLGGGGFRLFAANAAVRAIERLLGGDRSRIDEVWGSSGGAMLGYAFSQGHDLSVVEELGYHLYHGKTHEIPGLDLHTATKIARRAISWGRPDEGSRPEMTAWVELVDSLCPPQARGPARIPFYALASNTRWRHPVALTDPANIVDEDRDLLVGCDSREATGASMAVPFLVNPLQGLVKGFEREQWFDGSIAEENPIMLPFIKWKRDRRRDPDGTPPRLKVALVNLNMRFSESRTLSFVHPSLAKWAKRVTDLFDLMLDSKTSAIVRMLRELDDVEILTATLHLGQMKFIARGGLPEIIRSGQVIEGWQLRFHDDAQELEIGG